MSKDSENERLGREWMASEHWGGWRVGMVCAVTGQVVVRVDDTANIWSDTLPRVAPPGTCPTPDVSHPGTRAFLLEDVRRAWASEGAVNWQSGPEWHYVVKPGCQFFNPGALYGKGKTEQAALVEALRAAPEKTK